MAIILEKGGDSHRINLEKKAGKPLTGEIIINLDWNKGGFLKSLFGNAVDLDLGCFYELSNGTKMLIDGLQFSHGRGGNRHQNTDKDVMTSPLLSGIKEMIEVVVLPQAKQSW